GIGAFGAALLALTLTLCVIASGVSLKDAVVKDASVSLALVLCAAASWMGALLARDLIALVVVVEAALPASVGLVVVHSARERAPPNGALRMLSLGCVGGALMLLGVAMLGRAAGGFTLDALPVAHIRMPNLASAGAALIMLGLAIKVGVAPIHAWNSAVLGRGNAMLVLGVGALG